MWQKLPGRAANIPSTEQAELSARLGTTSEQNISDTELHVSGKQGSLGGPGAGEDQVQR